MKNILLSVVLATTLALTSCQFDYSDIWDKLDEYGQAIKDHEQRISALEELCKQMNTNIEALQTLVDALEKRDYVTNVSEVRSNGEVIGYTISFAYSDTITIYHGEDGKDGANGKDGYTPQIGVMKDTDGIYYWTLDGEWLLDGKGNKIQANDVNGTDGTNGTDGKDGVTPQLKIENDYWYVSYDNGATWTELGRATGENCNSIFDSVFIDITQDADYVYFYLADGSVLMLPKYKASIEPDSPIVSLEAVDLGLNHKWASCNLGANKPEDFGDYFAWGEITTKVEYSESTYKFDFFLRHRKNAETFEGEPEYDAATATLGENWRMPNQQDVYELCKYCDFEWTSLNGVNGIKIIGRNGNSIFLPAAGYRDNTSINSTGIQCNYWTSMRACDTTKEIYWALSINLHAGNIDSITDYWDDCVYAFGPDKNNGYLGMPIRPVLDPY